jgi:hypothetical protein
MPNIAPLISHMPDSQPLYAAYGSVGSGATSLVLNNSSYSTIPITTCTLQPNVPFVLDTRELYVDYGTSTITVNPVIFSIITNFGISSTSAPVTGDTLTFKWQVVEDGTNTITLPQTLIVLADKTISPYGITIPALGALSQTDMGTHTYTINFTCTYTTTGTTPWTLVPTSIGVLQSFVLASEVN